MRQITFQVKEEDFKIIEEEALKNRRSKSSLVRYIVLKNLENQNETL